MAGSDLFTGTLDLLILKAVSWGPRHGYAIGRWIRDTTHDAPDSRERVCVMMTVDMCQRKSGRGAAPDLRRAFGLHILGADATPQRTSHESRMGQEVSVFVGEAAG